MKRREFITLLGGAAAAWPLAAHAQQPPKLLRVGTVSFIPKNQFYLGGVRAADARTGSAFPWFESYQAASASL